MLKNLQKKGFGSIGFSSAWLQWLLPAELPPECDLWHIESPLGLVENFPDETNRTFSKNQENLSQTSGAGRRRTVTDDPWKWERVLYRRLDCGSWVIHVLHQQHSCCFRSKAISIKSDALALGGKNESANVMVKHKSYTQYSNQFLRKILLQFRNFYGTLLRKNVPPYR